MTRRKDEARLVREFLGEAEDLLSRAARGLDELESGREEASPEVVNAVFRAVHSLKGLAGMVGVTNLMDAAHAFESLLDGLRMGRVPADDETLKASRAALSALGEMVGAVSRGSGNPPMPPALHETLAAAVAPRTRRDHEPAPLDLPEPIAALLTDYERHRLREAQLRSRHVALLPVSFSLAAFDEGLRRAMGAVRDAGELIGTFPGTSGDPELMSFVLLAALPAGADLESVARQAGSTGWTIVAAAQPAAPPPETADVLPLFSSETVRVPLEKIGALLDVLGDLSLAARSLEQALARVLPQVSDRALRHEANKASAQVQKAAASVSRAALGLRLVPVEQLADRLARAVRAIASAEGKEIELDVVGGETELDKVLADELVEPLLHIVRNAVDHGIEPPSRRVEAGKPAAGRVTLSAEARGREVVLTLSDDGRGIDPDAVVRRAREKGLLAPGEEPADPLSVIFLPGFSTASEVSEVSGRGVGLDVVRATLAGLKGSVAVRSEPGRGTAFEILLPVTLAMVESLLVGASGRYFALPSSGVSRTFVLDGIDARSAEDEAGRLPLVPLARLLGLGGAEDGRIVVVAEEGGARAGLVVSEVEGLYDLIIKPLPEEIPRAPEVTGAAELPDGQLALVLDTGRLLARVPRLEAAA